MLIDGKKRQYWGYITPIHLLERALNAAGIKAEFKFGQSERWGKYIFIESTPAPYSSMIIIGGKTPVEVLRAVCCSVIHGTGFCPDLFDKVKE